LGLKQYSITSQNADILPNFMSR